ncbi:hypothetical protein [Acinetobacter baumannii]
MNYLHNILNHTPFHYSFRQCAAMDMCESINFLEDGSFLHEIRYSKNCLKELEKIHEIQVKNRKLYQRFKKPKLGRKPLTMSNKGYLCLDGQELAFDKTLLVELVWGYDFECLNEYPDLRILIKAKFQELAANIVQNYELYATQKDVSLEKVLNLYLTCLTGIYFMEEDCPDYDNQEFEVTGFHGKHDQPMLLAEQLISEARGKVFTYAAEKYGEEYNKEQSRIIAETCKAIIKAWR